MVSTRKKIWIEWKGELTERYIGIKGLIISKMASTAITPRAHCTNKGAFGKLAPFYSTHQSQKRGIRWDEKIGGKKEEVKYAKL